MTWNVDFWLQRSPTFTGEERGYDGWNFKIKAYVGQDDKNIILQLDEVSKQTKLTVHRALGLFCKRPMLTHSSAFTGPTGHHPTRCRNLPMIVRALPSQNDGTRTAAALKSTEIQACRTARHHNLAVIPAHLDDEISFVAAELKRRFQSHPIAQQLTWVFTSRTSQESQTARKNSKSCSALFCEELRCSFVLNTFHKSQHETSK